MGFTESNTCWDLLPDNQCLPQWTRGWWETCQWSLAYNQREENQSAHQPGGTSILCINKMVHQAQCPGNDPTRTGTVELDEIMRTQWVLLTGGDDVSAMLFQQSLDHLPATSKILSQTWMIPQPPGGDTDRHCSGNAHLARIR